MKTLRIDYRYESYNSWKRAVREYYSFGMLTFYGDKDIGGAQWQSDIEGSPKRQCAEWDGAFGSIWDVLTHKPIIRILMAEDEKSLNQLVTSLGGKMS